MIETALISRLLSGETLSANDSQQLFSSLDDAEPDDVAADSYYLAAIVALMSRGPTAPELEGIVADIRARSIDLRAALTDCGTMVDISGTGGDVLDTPNVGSLASFVVAAGGVAVAKQATRSFTGVHGSADVYRLLGLDVMNSDLDHAVDLLRTTGVTALHTPSHSPALARRVLALRRLRRLDLSLLTPWHLVAWVYSPFPLTARVYGVYSDDYRVPLASLFARHYPKQRTLVVWGGDIDEVSVCAPTTITEVIAGERRDYTATPVGMGLQTYTTQEASIYSPEECVRLRAPGVSETERREVRASAGRRFESDVFAILRGEGRPAHQALVAANAGAALYAADKVETLAEGTTRAVELLRSGAVAEVASAFAAACDNTDAAERLRV